MMDEQRLDHLLDRALDDAAVTYRTDAPPPGDALWARIEAEAFDGSVADGVASSPAARGVTPMRHLPWAALTGLMAATLLIGVAIGRMSKSGDTTQFATNQARIATTIAPASSQYTQETEEFLGRTAVLLASLPADNGAAGAAAGESNTRASAQLVAQAGQLLTTTRLMMDSPVGNDLRMRQLLQDLELVLAQVARLQPQRQRAEMQFISSALEQRDLVPRLRSAVADLAAGDH